MQDVDVVIVTYNSAATVSAAIRSVLTCPRVTSVVVVDNASVDGSADASRTAGAGAVIDNSTNVGFAAGVNQGLKACMSEYVLLLNPDAELEAGSLDQLTQALDDDAGAVIAGAALVATDGRLEAGARRFSTVVNRLFWHLPLPWRPHWSTPEYRDTARMATSLAPVSVDYLWGAALLVRRRFLQDIGGLDEGFFLYSEDEDLGRQARARGFVSLLVPRARAVHVGGASTPDPALAQARIIAANALLLEKWEGPRAGLTYRRVIGVVLALRSLLLRAVARRDEADLAARTSMLLRSGDATGREPSSPRSPRPGEARSPGPRC